MVSVIVVRVTVVAGGKFLIQGAQIVFANYGHAGTGGDAVPKSSYKPIISYNPWTISVKVSLNRQTWKSTRALR